MATRDDLWHLDATGETARWAAETARAIVSAEVLSTSSVCEIGADAVRHVFDGSMRDAQERVACLVFAQARLGVWAAALAAKRANVTPAEFVAELMLLVNLSGDTI